MTVTLADIEDAAAALKGSIIETPFLHASTLSKLTGAEVWLKFENHQYTGSFKDRGALNRLRMLGPAERRAGVVAMSAGNHAQGVAYHAGRLGIPATIVMPLGTPFVKITGVRVAPGGLLATFSCSGAVDLPTFLGMVFRAARRAERSLRLLEVLGAGPDHPQRPEFGRSRYLKGALLAID